MHGQLVQLQIGLVNRKGKMMIKRYWRGYNCLPKWRKPEFWADAIVFSTPEWNYAIQFPKILIRVRSKKRAKERSRV